MDDPAAPPAPVSVQMLCRLYDVDLPHGQQVGRWAVRLFDCTLPAHRLAPRYRDVIMTAGLLHNVALSGGVSKHHKRGRDILLRHPLTDLADDDRALIAVTTVFHRKPWKSSRLGEPSYLALPADDRPVALALAALVRIADGLDYSQSHSTQPVNCSAGERGVRLLVRGPYAAADAARALEKADLWRALFPAYPLMVRTVSSHSSAEEDA